MVPFFLIFVAFLAIVTFSLKKNSRLEQEKFDSFFERERLTTSTRKKDVSKLAYISVPIDTFPIGRYADDSLTALEAELISLSNQKILNLNGKSNTDLKIEYGIANFEFLTDCDENYIRLISLLAEYGKRLAALSYVQDAVTVLQFGVTIRSDISSNYTLLAELYRRTNQERKLQSLIAAAEALNSPQKNNILEKLNET